jgi:DNA-binding HxlR family transcriptional regulator
MTTSTERVAASACDGALDAMIADVFSRSCPSREALENVVSKWGTLALLALTEGSYRFNALRRRVEGVSEKMLSQSLQSLERDGLVTREVVSTIPPRVEYSLTALGERIARQLTALIGVLEGAMPEITEARSSYAGR